MNIRQRNVGNHLLFCINIFICFLLLFENRLELPSWLQATGRLHPLLLHFPIVLLLLAFVLEFFRTNDRFKNEPFFQTIADYLLFFGVLTAGITAVLGMFLSSEGGYDSNLLRWHKWSGILIVAMGSIIYWLRSYSWFKVAISRIFILGTTLCIIIAGHFGATLTHGENFVLAPFGSEEQGAIAFNDAVVYDHLIQPLFEAKCQSCHNMEKDKGKLKLLDSVSIVKGGKSGKLFVAGNPDVSLLLERIHLSPGNKKHMPPMGKPQLTEQEKDLLYWWVKSGALFSTKLAALPAGDSLRLLATNFINSGDAQAEVFSFSAASPELVRSLNNKNRTVYAYSRQSPALGVNLFNRSAYSSKLISELEPIRQQVISLAADRLPVKDEDLRKVKEFENLRRLSLNFTEITPKGLKELVNLKELNSLSLSGTNLNYKELQALIPLFANLKKVFVWNAGIDSNEVKKLRETYPAIEWHSGFIDDGAHPLQLNNVLLVNNTQVFADRIAVRLRHPIKEVQIRYTTDGSDPDSIHSKLFSGAIDLEENTIIKARAYKQGWFKSEVVQFNFFKNSFKPDTVILSNLLHEKFQGMGSETFFDGRLGGLIPWGDKWAGISGKPMDVSMRFDQTVLIGSISMQILIHPAYAAFPPAVVEIWGGSSESELRLLSRIKPLPPGKNVVSSIERIGSEFKPHQINYLKLVITPPKWPSWHSNKGKSALLMIDEIFLN